MIDLTLQLLRYSDFKGISENIDIAKGKYKIPMSVKEGIYYHKRFKK